MPISQMDMILVTANNSCKNINIKNLNYLKDQKTYVTTDNMRAKA